MRKKQKSILLHCVDSIWRGAFAWFRSGAVGYLFLNAFYWIDHSYRSSNTRFFQKLDPDMETRKRKRKYAFLVAVEKSRFLCFFDWIRHWLFRSTVSSVGRFGVLFGAFASAFWFVAQKQNFVSLIVSVIVCVSAVPLLSSQKSLSYAIENSIVSRRLLFVFCGLSKESFPPSDLVAQNRYWVPLLLALLFGALTIWVPILRVLFFATLLVVVCLFFSFPEVSVAMLLFALPFLNLTGNPTRILILWVLITDLAWLLKASGGRRSIRFGVLDLLVAFFAFLFFMGGIVGVGGAPTVYAGLASALMITFWFPTVSMLSNSDRKEQAISAFLTSGGICALAGVAEYFFTDMELKWVDASRFADIEGRVTSFFSNPNILAVYLLLIIPIALSRLFCNRYATGKRIFGGIVFLFALQCLLFTWSRGAWLGAILEIIVFLLFYSERSFEILFFSLFPIAFAGTFLPHSITNRFGSIASFSESSIRYRFYTWRSLLSLFRENKWGIGVGEAAFRCIYPHYAISGTENVMHAHQLFLQILISIGIPGVIVFLIFVILLTLFIIAGLGKAFGKMRATMLGSFCAALGVMTMGMFDYVWYHYGMLFLFWTVAALSTLTNDTEIERKENENERELRFCD